MSLSHTCLCALLRKPEQPMQHCRFAVQPAVMNISRLHDAQAHFPKLKQKWPATAEYCAG